MPPNVSIVLAIVFSTNIIQLQNPMRRVVVTGLGAVTPLGVGMLSFPYLISNLANLQLGIRRTWQRLLAGDCGIVNILNRDERYAQVPCQIAATVPSGKKSEGGWDATEWLAPGV